MSNSYFLKKGFLSFLTLSALMVPLELQAGFPKDRLLGPKAERRGVKRMIPLPTNSVSSSEPLNTIVAVSGEEARRVTKKPVTERTLKNSNQGIKSIRQRSSQDYYQLGIKYEEKELFLKASRFYFKAAKGGMNEAKADASFNFARHLFGLAQVSRQENDLLKANHFFILAAEAGHEEAFDYVLKFAHYGNRASQRWLLERPALPGAFYNKHPDWIYQHADKGHIAEYDLERKWLFSRAMAFDDSAMSWYLGMRWTRPKFVSQQEELKFVVVPLTFSNSNPE
ncbi:MAG: hypothetical protein K2P93_03845 [Alphaproteobacteria bacterium]|nr:hypothetical protein [Alphaproteobacteria bacterium]